MPTSIPFDATLVDALALAELCRRYDVKELALFGSSARGQMRPDSDVDLLIEFAPGVRTGLIKFQSLVEELESLIGHPVDLVTKRGLKPLVSSEVLKDARLLCAA